MTGLSEQVQTRSCCPCSGKRDRQISSASDLRSVRPVETKRVLIPGGIAFLGTASPIIVEDEEAPLRCKTIRPFEMAQTTVTNAEFQRFVGDTGHVTEAEHYGWSFVFWSDIPDRLTETKGVQGVEWWRRVEGADWYNITGPDTADEAWHPDHPVVHVSWNDATAFAAWAGGRLPTEIEWEHAARGGLEDVPFPWGHDEPDDEHAVNCNIWQGRFPHLNTARDGYRTTAPAQSFKPNAYGVYNMVGNVWEWITDPFVVRSQKRSAKARRAATKGYRLIKGGSFLCHRSYCYRYRIAARSGNSPNSATSHMGFRVVWDV